MEHDEEARSGSENAAGSVTRRLFLRTGAAALGGMAVVSAASGEQTERGADAGTADRTGHRSPKESSFLDLLRVPDQVTAYRSFEKTLPAGMISLQRNGEQWSGGQVVIESRVGPDSLALALGAPSTPIAIVHVRWLAKIDRNLQALGDAWERSYGDLGWRNLIPERVMPWYFATYDDVTCDGYGVKTDARALCFWQLDPQGVSLWLNVTNGGNGVELGERQLKMATVVTRRGAGGEDASEAIAGLCLAMCARTSRRTTPIYGANDWDYSYGRSTAETILRDTEFIVKLSPGEGVSTVLGNRRRLE